MQKLFGNEAEKASELTCVGIRKTAVCKREAIIDPELETQSPTPYLAMQYMALKRSLTPIFLPSS